MAVAVIVVTDVTIGGGGGGGSGGGGDFIMLAVWIECMRRSGRENRFVRCS